MVTGLVLGKFYPLHLGHVGLIEFAQSQCDELIVLVCASDKEDIPGSIRLEWLKETFKSTDKVKPVLLDYSENELPNTSVSSKKVSLIWSLKIKSILVKIDIIFSSEAYGEYLAEFLGCRHIMFDPDRTIYNISATEIRADVYKHWNYLPNSTKSYFTKKKL